MAVAHISHHRQNEPGTIFGNQLLLKLFQPGFIYVNQDNLGPDLDQSFGIGYISNTLSVGGSVIFGESIGLFIDKSISLSLFNPETEWTMSENEIISTSKNSALLGQPMKGKVYGIINNNKLQVNG